VIEYARNVLGWKDANSAEFAPSAAHKVVRFLRDTRAWTPVALQNNRLAT